jgi:hypothetical protein
MFFHARSVPWRSIAKLRLLILSINDPEIVCPPFDQYPFTCYAVSMDGFIHVQGMPAQPNPVHPVCRPGALTRRLDYPRNTRNTRNTRNPAKTCFKMLR